MTTALRRLIALATSQGDEAADPNGSDLAGERLYARVAPCVIGAIEHYLLLWLPITVR